MKYKTKLVDGRHVSFSSDWIDGLEERIHFDWYYHQAKLVYECCHRDQKLLEIGIGTGLLSGLLKKRGWRLITLDIDEEKYPDFCCDALEFEYFENSIDVVLAFEIFEHIPFETFKKVVNKLGCQGVKNIYFSLPWSVHNLFDFSIKLPKVKRLDLQLNVPKRDITQRTHFWELTFKDKPLVGEKHLISKATLNKVFIANGYNLSAEGRLGYIEYFSATAIDQ